MRHLALAFAALSLVATPSLAAPCKDARGKFVKCPQAVKGKDGRCRVSSGQNKGKFTRCKADGRAGLPAHKRSRK